MLNNGIGLDFAVYNFSTTSENRPSTAGRVIVSLGEDLRLPSVREQFSVKRVDCTNKVLPDKKNVRW